MTEPSIPTPAEGCNLLEAELRKSGNEVPEMVAAVQYAPARAVVWAVTGAFIAAVLGIAGLSVLTRTMQRNDVPLIIAISVMVLGVLVAMYLLLLLTWNAVRLCGRTHFSGFKLAAGLPLPGSGWFASDDLWVHIWTYRALWPSLVHYVTLDRESFDCSIGSIDAMSKHCSFEVVSPEGILVRLRGGPKADVIRMAEMLRSDAGRSSA